MQDILTCAMGLDVHRDVIVACLAKGELGTDPEIEIRSFSTLIPEMRKLRDWVIETGCHHIAMESTGIYWQPRSGGFLSSASFRLVVIIMGLRLR